eukprot:GHVS01041143.1.p1 GENE.GHVS01041143.1~~GHVS01041143.1.p1  ORF type:complete len:474 (-),score=115.55 GHVS01041143.1:277-1698(-)
MVGKEERTGKIENDTKEVLKQVGEKEEEEEMATTVVDNKSTDNDGKNMKDPFTTTTTTFTGCAATTNVITTNVVEETKKEDEVDIGGGDDVMVVIQLKWSARVIDVSFSPADFATFTVADLKAKIEDNLSIPIHRQKLLGLGIKTPSDNDMLSSVEFKSSKRCFVLLGTPQAEAFVDPQHLPNLPPVFNDLDCWDYLPSIANGFDLRTPTHLSRLHKAIATTDIRLIHPPRPGLKLLVLDLDYTLFDCKPTDPLTGLRRDIFDSPPDTTFSTSTASGAANATPTTTGSSSSGGRDSLSQLIALEGGVVSGGGGMEDLKRPYLEHFLEVVHNHYDIAIWSQTHWRWVEVKCTELGLLTNKKFNISFVLDRSSMFTVASRSSEKGKRAHEVKALEVIWSKFPDRWGPHNTLHVDDLAKNFAMNPQNGVKVSAYRTAKRSGDRELLKLAEYLQQVAAAEDVRTIDHSQWKKMMKFS